MTKTDSRRIGRPDARTSEALNRHILDTATRLFIEQGYAATSMEQVATATGAGKQTIYRRYSSKEELFTAVVSSLVKTFVEAPGKEEIDRLDPLTALRDTCWEWLDLISKPEAMALYRILIAEALRFPSLVERVVHALAPFDEVIRRRIAAGRETGLIRRDFSAEDLLRLFTGMISGWLIKQNLLGIQGFDTEEERLRFFDNAWTVFLRGAAA